MLSYIRRNIGIKLFVSYLLVILIGLLILVVFTELLMPVAFERHMRAMADIMRNSDMVVNGMNLEADLYHSFRNAFSEVLLYTAIAVFISASLMTWLITRQIVTAVQRITKATERITNGHYDERVPISRTLAEADELEQLAIRFNRMAEQLNQVETMRRQLIGDISHELRTPLTTIRGSLEGLLDGVLPPEASQFQDILRETQRLERLVADLQELSRVEAGAYSLNLTSLSIRSLVERIIGRLRPQFDEKNVAIHLQCTQNLPQVKADEDRLSQILINLIGNALQYTPPHGQVYVRCTLDTNGYIRVRIEDTGIGIPPEHLPHLFTRFYRVDKSRSRAGGGSGIGLTIAKVLVESHGGRIWAESEGRNLGSAFIFTLPPSHKA